MQNGYQGIDWATQNAMRVQAQGVARRAMIKGLLWFVTGISVSLAAYAGTAPGERYPVFWGAAGFGGYQFLRGLYYFSNPMKLLDKTLVDAASNVDAGVRPTQHGATQPAHPGPAATSGSHAGSRRETAASVNASGVGTMAALLARLTAGGSAVVNPWELCWTTAKMASPPSESVRGVIAVHRMGVLWSTESGLKAHPESWAPADFLLQTTSLSSMTVSPPDSIAWATEGFLSIRVVASGRNWLQLTDGEGRNFVFNDLPDDARTKEVLQALESLLPTP
jgi:hypothetical protein